MNYFRKKVSLFAALAICLAASAASFWLFEIYATPPAVADELTKKSQDRSGCDYTASRLKGYQYIKPLLDQSPECESQKLSGLKQDILRYLDNQKQAGFISTASVYIKDFSSEDWIYVNPGESYLPGSLFKLPVMMTILKMSETNPALLDKKITFDPRKVVNVPQTYTTKALQPGNTYTVKELLTYMIAYSDNSATQLLNGCMDPQVLINIFSDLGLTPPKPDAASYLSYTITPRDYSVFMAALYNGSYLTIAESEYATSLLAQCSFKEGLVKGLPENVKVAHKFGEAGSQQEHQLHETALVYVNNSAYLVTVMTKGTDLKNLATTIGGVARIAHARLATGS